MKYWFDCEFIEDGHTINLVSIGIVAEDGRELELFNKGCQFSQASDWVRDNVLTQLPVLQFGGVSQRPEAVTIRQLPDELQSDQRWRSRTQIRDEVLVFVAGPDKAKPEFWAYYADYDWVVLCQLFGRMIDLPKGWPMFCMDIKQWAVMLGNPKLPKQLEGEHSALADAKWNRAAWSYLSRYSQDLT